MGLIPGSGGSPGEGKGNSLQYSCLGNPLTEELDISWDRKESDTTEQLNNNNFSWHPNHLQGLLKQISGSCGEILIR